MLTRFIQMPIKVRPEEDGSYIVFYKAGARYETMDFTTEFGWNTTRLDDGSALSKTAIPDSEMARCYAHWLKPYNIGSENWFDQIEEMMEEIKGELYQYADRKLNDDEMWKCSNLEDMYDLLERAKDYAEAYR